jgi:alpha-glucosidase
MKAARHIAGLILICFVAIFAANAARAAEEVSVSSPEDKLRVELSLRQAPAGGSELVYEVKAGEQAIVLPSRLGVRLADGALLGADCELVEVKQLKIDEGFEQFPGKRRLVTNRSNEATLTLRERGEPRRRWQVVVRAYDDGIALRYRFPYQNAWRELELAEEQTEFRFPEDAVAVALPLAGFTTSHENLYERRPVSELATDSLYGPPMLIELPGKGWAAVLEANLKDYAGMYLARGDSDEATLTTRLSPQQDEPKVAVRALLPHASPWRVVLFAPRAEQLIESDLPLRLNAPVEIADTSWIKPGATTFPWWNDFYEVEVPFKMGLNTETAKYYIDFCAEHGIPYHSLDGVNDLAWYGGPIAPYAGADITQGVDGLDFPAVIAYAKEKGVRLRLWMHWEAARQHMARAFPLYRQWGIEGVMIDFMDRDDQEMVRFQRELLELAAENQLTVTFHGVASPTGLERAFPNLLNSEAVMNLEYDKWNEGGVPPEHDVTVPFARMLAGPLDYHQGTLRGVPLAEFKPQVAAPVVIGTPCRMLATYVVFQNHLPMMADYPSAYRGHPLTKVIAGIPATWDDTRALEAKVGESVAIARRSGDEWWIGAMTDRRQRELKVPLDFLGVGKFRADVYQDDLGAERKYELLTRDVTAADVLTLPLAESGGALVKLTPYAENKGAPNWKLAWSDEFDTLDRSKWRLFEGYEPTNDSQQAYLPEQVTVRDGNLVIRSENKAAGKLPYRSGQVFSERTQRLGRWEVRAKLPGTRGMWPAIWLLPDGPWPSEGEIDIMENRGNQPALTSSAFHWGTQTPYTHDYHAAEQQMSVDGTLVSYPDGFHTYAVEWCEDQIRFFVDDVHHATFYSDECGDYFPKLHAPMRLVINTAIGGHFLPPPDETTLWPQEFLIDWVRVYEPADGPSERQFADGSFDANGGSLAGWHVFGNRVNDNSNIAVVRDPVRDGAAVLTVSGQDSGGENYSGVSQGISVTGGEEVRAKLLARIPSENSLANTKSTASMKIEFYNRWGDYFGGPAMLGAKELRIADGATPTDQWKSHELVADVPEGAVEARLSIVFAQAANEPGAVLIDGVEFGRVE